MGLAGDGEARGRNRRDDEGGKLVKLDNGRGETRLENDDTDDGDETVGLRKPTDETGDDERN